MMKMEERTVLLSNILFAKTIIKSKYIRDYYLAKNGLTKTINRFNEVGNKRLYTAEDAHKVIYDFICSGNPFMVGRYGSIELFCTAKENLGISYKKASSLETLCNNAGFFPNNNDCLKRFSDLIVSSSRFCDVQGVWYLPFEDYAVENWLREDVVLTELRYLEPWFSSTPWTKALAGKNVLVIHPFANTIERQYRINREKIFQNNDLLPEFNLITVKAVQTIAGTKDERFSTWFDALEYMYNEAMKEDFDIALIGCGAYGYPLAAKIKASGRQAIHMGGVLQAMFGIKGKRWEVDPNPIVRNLYNEYWVRPDQSDIPTENQRVENGCYW